jgi:hypothetical protein
MHSFHRLSILERATDHKCNNNCNRPNEMWVGFKYNGLIVFSQRGDASKVYNTCIPAFPLSPSPPPPTHLLSLVPSPLLPHPPSSKVVGRDISGSGALAGVFSQEEGGPSVMTGRLSYLMDQSCGRILPERRSQEMTSSNAAPFPQLPWGP